MQSELIKNLAFWDWKIDKLVTYRRQIILITSWDLPDLVCLTWSLLKKPKKSHVHHSWRSQDEKLYIRHPQAQLLMENISYILSQVYKWLYSILGAFPLQLTLPMQNRVLQARLGDGTSIAEMSSCLTQARWAASFVQPLLEHVGKMKQRFLESHEI